LDGDVLVADGGVAVGCVVGARLAVPDVAGVAVFDDVGVGVADDMGRRLGVADDVDEGVRVWSGVAEGCSRSDALSLLAAS
jgi:hypothetical protein